MKVPVIDPMTFTYNTVPVFLYYFLALPLICFAVAAVLAFLLTYKRNLRLSKGARGAFIAVICLFAAAFIALGVISLCVDKFENGSAFRAIYAGYLTAWQRHMVCMYALPGALAGLLARYRKDKKEAQ